jgi:hypothetical protein
LIPSLSERFVSDVTAAGGVGVQEWESFDLRASWKQPRGMEADAQGGSRRKAEGDAMRKQARKAEATALKPRSGGMR